jgi:hypothetical protein
VQGASGGLRLHREGGAWRQHAHGLRGLHPLSRRAALLRGPEMALLSSNPWLDATATAVPLVGRRRHRGRPGSLRPSNAVVARDEPSRPERLNPPSRCASSPTAAVVPPDSRGRPVRHLPPSCSTTRVVHSESSLRATQSSAATAKGPGLPTHCLVSSPAGPWPSPSRERPTRGKSRRHPLHGRPRCEARTAVTPGSARADGPKAGPLRAKKPLAPREKRGEAALHHRPPTG